MVSMRGSVSLVSKCSDRTWSYAFLFWQSVMGTRRTTKHFVNQLPFPLGRSVNTSGCPCCTHISRLLTSSLQPYNSFPAQNNLTISHIIILQPQRPGFLLTWIRRPILALPIVQPRTLWHVLLSECYKDFTVIKKIKFWDWHEFWRRITT